MTEQKSLQVVKVENGYEIRIANSGMFGIGGKAKEYIAKDTSEVAKLIKELIG